MKRCYHRVMFVLLGVSLTVQAAVADDPIDAWKEMRFGMFVHWGLYSGLAGTWEGRRVASSGGMEWIQARVKADTESYAKASIPLFQPKPDFAQEWAALAREAGCRYVVFTTKHHDGFSLHHSDVDTFHAGAVLGRDLVREIVDALRAESLKIGFYHSVIDWHHDQYTYNRSRHLPHPLRGRPYPNGERDHAIYLDYLHAQVEELASRYGPVDIFWWDYSAVDFQGDDAWRAFELMERVRKHQPRVLMNNRLFRIPEAGWRGMGTSNFAMQLDRRYGDFVTPEQHIPATGVPGLAWEVCMTMNTTWGYSEHDRAWKSTRTLIRNLVDIVSKGGNYLLNIGPTADGTVPEASIVRMREIGAWMAVNGDAIHGTQATPFAETPWGRCTRKELGEGRERIFFHVFDWSVKDGRLDLPVPGMQGTLAGIRLLGSDQELTAQWDGNTLRIEGLPARPVHPDVSVVALDLVP
jgi:alpha-L-fucosidase